MSEVLASVRQHLHMMCGARFTASRALADVAPEIESRVWTSRVLQSPLPVMVHFFANINLPFRCSSMAPVIDDVARKYAGKLDAVRRLHNPD